MYSNETINKPKHVQPNARAKTTLLQRMARGILQLAGWEVKIIIPIPRKCVVIGAPHTSAWDLPLTLLLMGATGLRLRWVAKHQLFRWPVAWFWRALGGLPVNRSVRSEFVKAMHLVFSEHDDLRLAILPEGTRRQVDHWKTGFYYMARGADVPVVLGYADFSSKTVGLGPSLDLTNDIEADMIRIRAFYADKIGQYPERQSQIRLRPSSKDGD